MELIEYGNRKARIVLLQPVGEHDEDSVEKELACIKENTSEDFRLIALRVSDWNKDLSPWEAPAVFGKEGFGGCAAETLATITGICGESEVKYCIGGYSLAGLFALWAAYRRNLFSGVAAASPSMWFPGFTELMREQKVKCRNIYLSRGDREEKTRNPVMAEVGNRIREAQEILKEQNVKCILEWNEGNHFKDADLRTARAFSWVIKQLRNGEGSL